MNIIFKERFRSVPEGFGIQVPGWSSFPLEFCGEKLYKEKIYSLLNLGIIDVQFPEAISKDLEEEENSSEFDDPNAPCLGCPNCNFNPKWHDQLGW